MFSLIVTGPPGSGKSRVLTAVHDRLGDSGYANAMIEVDELERSYPPLDLVQAMSHVGFLAESFREAGYPTICVTATIEDNDYRAALMNALNADETMLVCLEAEPDTLERRIRDREPPSWSGLDELVRNARTLADTMMSLTSVDLFLSTEGREVDDVASELLAALQVG